MTLHPATNPTRAMTLLMLAFFGGVALWLFQPWGSHSTDWNGSGSAALPPSLRVAGDVAVTSSGNTVTRLEVPLALRGDDGIALTEGGRLHAETLLGIGASAAVPAKYTVTWPTGDGDEILEPGEQALLTVDLPEKSSIHPGNPMALVLKPAGGSALRIEDVLN
jgi:hypothetical protein